MYPAYLIQDPFDDDAIRLITSMLHCTGLRPVCFYTEPKSKFYGQRMYRQLRSDLVAAEFDVFDGNYERLVQDVTRRFDIRAIVPYRDDLVSTAATLLGLLNIDWNDAETYGRFRDKYALKQHINSVDPAVRLPISRRVGSVEEVYNGPLPDRFVLKPNDGMGSVGIGFFSPEDRTAIESHLASHDASVWILEEFIDGIEYRVNGQVRRDGTVETLLIGEYIPRVIDEQFTFPYFSESRVSSDDSRFGDLHAYAAQLLAATGLRGSPFHMEVRVDQSGPAMIDLGARPPSEASGVAMSILHPERPNFYDVAAHDYIGDNDFAIGQLDYVDYDRLTFALAYGFSEQDGIINTLEGVEYVSTMDEFLFWSVAPRVGDRLTATRELRGSPFIVNLRHDGDRERTIELADHVRDSIVWNRGDGPGARIRSRYATLVPRVANKLAWTTSIAASRARSKLGV